MEERFDELFVSTYKIWDCYNDKPAPKNVMEIKDFIKQEIDLAVQQERERCIKCVADVDTYYTETIINLINKE